MKILKLMSLLTGIIAILGISCKENKTNKDPKWQSEYRATAMERMRIGSDSLYDDKYTFSAINDFNIDKNGRIYVLDRMEMCIKIFNAEGGYIKTIKLQKGQGPKDIGRPVYMSLGHEDKIFVTDDANKRIAVLDMDGSVIDYIPVQFLPGMIAVNGGRVIITSSLGIAGEDALYEYEYPSKKFIKSYIKLTPRNKLYKRVGADGAFCFDAEGSLFYAFTLPCEITRIDQSGKVVEKYSRVLKKDVGYRINEMGLPQADILAFSINSFRDGKILHVMLDRSGAVDYTFDIFSKSGEWLLSLSGNELFDNWKGRSVRLDNNDDIYMEYWTPFPHIRKFSIKMEKIEKKN